MQRREPWRPSSRDHEPHAPGPEPLAVGFAVGVAVLLVGPDRQLVDRRASAPSIAVVFGFLWVRDVDARAARRRGRGRAGAPRAARRASRAGRGETLDEDDEPRALPAQQVSSRRATLGLGAVIGGARHRPGRRLRGRAGLRRPGRRRRRPRPARRTSPRAVRDRRPSCATPRRARSRAARVHPQQRPHVDGVPSFTIISNRCVHLGCPVQPNGPLDDDSTKDGRDASTATVTLIPIDAGRLRLPVPRRPVRHRGQPHRRPAGARARPLRVRDPRTATSCSASRSASARSRATGADAKIDNVHARRTRASTSTASEPCLYPLQPPRLMATVDAARSRRAGSSSRRRDRYPLDWLEERSGLVGGVKYFLFRKVPRDIELVAHARLGDADRVPRPGADRRDPRDVLQAGPGHGVRVDPAHHERPHARLARARHAPLGRERLHHPALLPHGRACSCSARTSTRAS